MRPADAYRLKYRSRQNSMAPTETNETADAPQGGWTVGTLFDAIAKGHPGYGDHTFFEGMYSQGNGYYGVMYGS